MNIVQEGDVLLFHALRFDTGNINVEGGITEMTGGFETAIYLSLFGGNEDDSGSVNNPLQWWGNWGENDPNKKYQSQTQHLLRALPISSANLLKIEKAVANDLQWFLDLSIIDQLNIVVTIPKANTVLIHITGEAEGQELDFNFTENWKAAA